MPSRLPTWCRGALFLFALLMCGVVFDSHAQTRIFDAHVDGNGQLLIRGQQLDGHRSASIRLGPHVLVICRACSSDQAVFAQVPNAMRDGRLPMRFQASEYSKDFYVNLLAPAARRGQHAQLSAAAMPPQP